MDICEIVYGVFQSLLSQLSSIYVRSYPLDIVSSPCKSTLLLFHEKPVLLIWRRKKKARTTLYEKKSKCTSHFSSQLHIWTIFLVKSLTKWHQDAITILLQRPKKSPTKALSYNYSYLQYNAFRCFYDTEIPISIVTVMPGVVYNIAYIVVYKSHFNVPKQLMHIPFCCVKYIADSS